MKHFHATVLGYNSFNEEKGTYGDGINMSFLEFTSEEDSCERARAIVKRNHFIVRDLRECNTCQFQNDLADNLRKMAS